MWNKERYSKRERRIFKERKKKKIEYYEKKEKTISGRKN